MRLADWEPVAHDCDLLNTQGVRAHLPYKQSICINRPFWELAPPLRKILYPPLIWSCGQEFCLMACTFTKHFKSPIDNIHGKFSEKLLPFAELYNILSIFLNVSIVNSVLLQ